MCSANQSIADCKTVTLTAKVFFVGDSQSLIIKCLTYNR